MKKFTPVSLLAIAFALVGFSSSLAHALSENAFISCVRADIETVDKLHGVPLMRRGAIYPTLIGYYFDSTSSQHETMRASVLAAGDCEELRVFVDQQTDVEIKRLQSVDFVDRATLSKGRRERWSDFMKPADIAKAKAVVTRLLKDAGFAKAAETLRDDQDYLRTFVLSSENGKWSMAKVFSSGDSSQTVSTFEAEDLDDALFTRRRNEVKAALAKKLDGCSCNWKTDVFAAKAEVVTGLTKAQVKACVMATNDMDTVRGYRSGQELLMKIGGLVSNIMLVYDRGMTACMGSSTCSPNRKGYWTTRAEAIIAKSKDCATLKKLVKEDNDDYFLKAQSLPVSEWSVQTILGDVMAVESSSRYSDVKSYMFKKLQNADMAVAARTFTYEHGLLRQFVSEQRRREFRVSESRMSKSDFEKFGVPMSLLAKGFKGEIEAATADEIEAFLFAPVREEALAEVRKLRAINP